MVNPFFDEVDQFAQLEQTGRMQDRRLIEHTGIRGWRSLIGPVSGKGERASALLE